MPVPYKRPARRPPCTYCEARQQELDSLRAELATQRQENESQRSQLAELKRLAEYTYKVELLEPVLKVLQHILKTSGRNAIISRAVDRDKLTGGQLHLEFGLSRQVALRNHRRNMKNLQCLHDAYAAARRYWKNLERIAGNINSMSLTPISLSEHDRLMADIAALFGVNWQPDHWE
jgi:hypothetical protein